MVCAIANHNRTALTFSRPRTPIPQLRRCAFMHSCLALAIPAGGRPGSPTPRFDAGQQVAQFEPLHEGPDRTCRMVRRQQAIQVDHLELRLVALRQPQPNCCLARRRRFDALLW